jgi:hypothetical protein
MVPEAAAPPASTDNTAPRACLDVAAPDPPDAAPTPTHDPQPQVCLKVRPRVCLDVAPPSRSKT